MSDPADLLNETPDELRGIDEWSTEIMAQVYAPWSQLGRAAERAAEWITELVDSRYS